MNQTENFYVQKRNYWLRFLHSLLDNKQVEREVLWKYFAPERIPEIKLKVQQQFEELLPQVPDFGRKTIDRFSFEMMKTVQSLAFYRVLTAEGIPLRTFGQIVFEIAEVGYRSPSPIAKLVMRARCYSPYFHRKMKRFLEEQKRSAGPEETQVDFVEGDGKNLLFGYNYTNCSAVYFLKKLDASEIHPYLCLCDYPMMRGLNIGFNREQNIAIGGSMCAVRVYRDYPTPRGWPPEEVPEYKNYRFGE